MRRLLFLVLVVWAGCGGGDGGGQQQPTACTLTIASRVIFGPPVAVGSTLAVPWSLRNYGDTAATITASIDSDTGSFRWPGGKSDTVTLELPPGYNADQSVICAPTTTGQLTGSIIASSADCPEQMVALSCTGRPPPSATASPSPRQTPSR